MLRAPSGMQRPSVDLCRSLLLASRVFVLSLARSGGLGRSGHLVPWSPRSPGSLVPRSLVPWSPLLVLAWLWLWLGLAWVWLGLAGVGSVLLWLGLAWLGSVWLVG